jgi:hypothetical protein
VCHDSFQSDVRVLENVLVNFVFVRGEVGDYRQNGKYMMVVVVRRVLRSVYFERVPAMF